MDNTDTSRPGFPFYLSAASVFVTAAGTTIAMCSSMSGEMEMPGGWTMSMIWMRMPGQTWLASAAMFLLMWLAMMVAMMLPSMLPVLLRFRISLTAAGSSRTGLPTALVTSGYFAVWMAIGAVVYVVGAFWALATMRWSALSTAVPALTGASLVLAGVLQFSPWKISGLGHCRNPIIVCPPRQHGGLSAAWLHGVRQGWFCGICCSGPMLAMIALGTMNLSVMIPVAGIIAAEKLLPNPKAVIRTTGFIALVAGSVVIIISLF